VAVAEKGSRTVTSVRQGGEAVVVEEEGVPLQLTKLRLVGPVLLITVAVVVEALLAPPIKVAVAVVVVS
jgi:hypothetical protein